MSANQEKLNEQLLNVVLSDKDSDEAKLKKVKYLVRLGADVNAKMYGKSVLSWVKKDEKVAPEIIEFLKEKGAKEWMISKEGAERLGYEMVWRIGGDEEEKIKEVKELLKEGADVNARSSYEYKNTALMEACRYGDVEVAKELIKAGADVNQKNINGLTALMWVSVSCNIEIMKELIKKGVDVNAQTNSGVTALMEASANGWIEGVEMLLQNGADVDLECDFGRTALTNASNLGYNNIVKVLEEHIKKKNDEKIKVSNSKGFGNRLLGEDR